MFADHAWPAVATPQQREEWTHQPCGAVVIDTDDSDLDDEDSVIPPLIYLEDYCNKDQYALEYLSDPPSAEPTPESGPPSETPTE